MKIRDLYSFGNSSNTRLETVSGYLQLTARKMIRTTPVDCGVPYRGGKRTIDDQEDIFSKGWSKCDGIEKISYHQKTDNEGFGLALDIVPYIKGKGFDYTATGRFGIIIAYMLEAWEELQDSGEIPIDLYLHAGGLWKNRGGDPTALGWDMAHFEIRDYPQIQRLT